MINGAVILLALLSAAICQAQDFASVSPERAGFSSERLARIRVAMERDIAAGEMAGAIGMVVRHGKVVYCETFGMADLEKSTPMRRDTIFRMYSMTKAVTGVAVMTLYEEGHFSLNDPISKFLPEFTDMKVAVERIDPLSAARSSSLEPAARPITILDLLRHTSGLNYTGPLDPRGDLIYRKLKITGGDDDQVTLGEMVRRLASAPLVHQPGTVWDYGYSIDVLARLVEVVSGQTVDRYFEEHVFRPLKMRDTAYWVPEKKWDRLATLYIPHPGGTPERSDSPAQNSYRQKPTLLMGGSGLVSTVSDYARFVQMLLNRGTLDGVRILAPLTVDLMRSNVLGDLPSVNNVNGRSGYGFGLTFAVNLGMEKTGSIGSRGEYNWGGAAGTAFWIDPQEDLTGLFMVQVMPQRTVKDQFKQLVYQALVDDSK